MWLAKRIVRAMHVVDFWIGRCQFEMWHNRPASDKKHPISIKLLRMPKKEAVWLLLIQTLALKTPGAHHPKSTVFSCECSPTSKVSRWMEAIRLFNLMKDPGWWQCYLIDLHLWCATCANTKTKASEWRLNKRLNLCTYSLYISEPVKRLKYL